MRKLRLETLVVESFETAGAPRTRGTVDGHADTESPNCGPYSYDANVCALTDHPDCVSDDTVCRAGCPDIATP